MSAGDEGLRAGVEALPSAHFVNGEGDLVRRNDVLALLAEPAPVADEGQAAGLSEAEVKRLERVVFAVVAEWLDEAEVDGSRDLASKIAGNLRPPMKREVDRILAARGATRDGAR